jgi:starch phosphorylase
VVWQKQLYKCWDDIKIISAEDNLLGDVSLGKSFIVKAKIKLGVIAPENVSVQLYFGYLDSKRRMSSSVISLMKLAGSGNDGTYTYEGVVSGDRVGHCGYVVRVVPQLEGTVVYLPGLITWQ